jgi:multiple antibiotic resistance protein
MSIETLVYFQILIALLSVMDPWGTIPIYLSLVEGQSAAQRRETARKTAVAVFVILALCALGGHYLLMFFSIDIHSFSIAGGIYLLLIAISLLQAQAIPGKSNPSEREEAMAKEDISVVPMAMPLLAGPGAVSSVILYADRMTGVADRLMLLLVIALSALVVWFFLFYAHRIGEKLGYTGMNILGRIVGLIIAALAVKFIMAGLGGYGVVATL